MLQSNSVHLGVDRVLARQGGDDFCLIIVGKPQNVQLFTSWAQQMITTYVGRCKEYETEIITSISPDQRHAANFCQKPVSISVRTESIDYWYLTVRSLKTLPLMQNVLMAHPEAKFNEIDYTEFYNGLKDVSHNVGLVFEEVITLYNTLLSGRYNIDYDVVPMKGKSERTFDVGYIETEYYNLSLKASVILCKITSNQFTQSGLPIFPTQKSRIRFLLKTGQFRQLMINTTLKDNVTIVFTEAECSEYNTSVEVQADFNTNETMETRGISELINKIVHLANSKGLYNLN